MTQLAKHVERATHDDDLREAVQHLVRVTTDLQAQARRKIPAYVDEIGYQSAGKVLDVPPQGKNMYRLQSLTAYVSAAAGATLTLGARIIPLATGITQWTLLGWLVRFEDTRNLTAATSGILYLEMTGEECADQYGW